MEGPVQELELLQKQLGSAIIEVDRGACISFKDVKDFLKSHGYVEQDSSSEEEVTDEGSVFFLDSPPPQPAGQCFKFPEKNPEPQYDASIKATRGSTQEWNNVAAFQLITRGVLPEEQQLKINATTPLEIDQTVHIRMAVQPEILIDNANFNVKLQVETLVAGVPNPDFLMDRERGIGFYPYYIRIDMEPLVDGVKDLCAVPIIMSSEQQPSDPASSRTISRKSTLKASVGYGPAQLTVGQDHEVQKTVVEAATEVKEIHEADGGNTASYRWSLLPVEEQRQI